MAGLVLPKVGGVARLGGGNFALGPVVLQLLVRVMSRQSWRNKFALVYACGFCFNIGLSRPRGHTYGNKLQHGGQPVSSMLWLDLGKVEGGVLKCIMSQSGLCNPNLDKGL